MAVNSYPSSLPSWSTNIQDNPRDPYRRSDMQEGPGKVRRKTTNVLYDLSFSQLFYGDQRETLMDFFLNNIKFTHTDPKDGTSSTFKFAGQPKIQGKVGANNPDKRQWEIELKLIRL